MPRKRKVAVANQENHMPKLEDQMQIKKPNKNEKPAKKLKREPDFMVGDGLNVVKVLLTAQKNDCNSKKCITELHKLYDKVNMINN